MPIGGYAAMQPILTSAARTTSGQSSVFAVGEFSRLVFYIDVTAASGTNESMIVKLQESPDQTNFWDLETVEITDDGDYRISTAEHTKYVRISYVISGTSPSFTFSINMAGRH